MESKSELWLINVVLYYAEGAKKRIKGLVERDKKLNIAGSSNGRTAAFGAVYLGSSPSLAASNGVHLGTRNIRIEL